MTLPDLSTVGSTILANIQEAGDGFTVDVVQFEDTTEQRALRTSTPIREFQVTTRPLTVTERAALKTFYYSTVTGSLGRFTWTNPEDGIQYTVKFKDKSFSLRNIDGVNFVASFILREVI